MPVDDFLTTFIPLLSFFLFFYPKKVSIIVLCFSFSKKYQKFSNWKFYRRPPVHFFAFSEEKISIRVPCIHFFSKKNNQSEHCVFDFLLTILIFFIFPLLLCSFLRINRLKKSYESTVFFIFSFFSDIIFCSHDFI